MFPTGRRKLQKSFRTLEQAANLCLIALALSDLLFCLAVFPNMFLPDDGRHSSNNSILVVYNLYQFFVINIFIMESTLLTVAMSLERFMAICFPLRQDLYLTTRRIKYVIAFTVVFSVSFNIPVLFRYEITPHCGLPDSYNLSNISTTRLARVHSPEVHLSPEDPDKIEPSALSASYRSRWQRKENSFLDEARILSTSGVVGTRDSTTSVEHPDMPATASLNSLLTSATEAVALPSRGDNPANNSTSSTAVNTSLQPLYFTVEQIKIGGSDAVDNVYRWAWAVAGNFIPLILLFYFNVCLWWKIYLSYKMRRQFHRPHQATRSSHILTITLVAIVVMFFILVAPSETVLALKNAITMEKATGDAIEHILNLMQTINFSVNFILYCIISPYFRKTLKYILLCGFYNIYQVSKDWKKDFETSLM